MQKKNGIWRYRNLKIYIIVYLKKVVCNVLIHIDRFAITPDLYFALENNIYC